MMAIFRVEERMAFIDNEKQELHCKIVYYGPGLSGKTTNLQYIYQKTHPDFKGKFTSLSTQTERTLFFDFSPQSHLEVGGLSLRFHLYTQPSAVFDDASRRLILRGVDALVFVADAQIERIESNEESLDDLRKHLKANGLNLDTLPMVIQYNKMDLPNAAPLALLESKLNPRKLSAFCAKATTGIGVFSTLKSVVMTWIRSYETAQDAIPSNPPHFVPPWQPETELPTLRSLLALPPSLG